MTHPVTAATAYCFAPDRRYSWWNQLIGSSARLIAAQGSRRRFAGSADFIADC